MKNNMKQIYKDLEILQEQKANLVDELKTLKSDYQLPHLSTKAKQEIEEKYKGIYETLRWIYKIGYKKALLHFYESYLSHLKKKLYHLPKSHKNYDFLISVIKEQRVKIDCLKQNIEPDITPKDIKKKTLFKRFLNWGKHV